MIYNAVKGSCILNLFPTADVVWHRQIELIVVDNLITIFCAFKNRGAFVRGMGCLCRSVWHPCGRDYICCRFLSPDSRLAQRSALQVQRQSIQIEDITQIG